MQHTTHHTPVLTPCNNASCVNNRNALFRKVMYFPTANQDWPLNRRSMAVCFSGITAVIAIQSRFGAVACPGIFFWGGGFTPGIFSGGGVQQIQLRIEGRENGELEAVAH
jgi:hypothetical protein